LRARATSQQAGDKHNPRVPPSPANAVLAFSPRCAPLHPLSINVYSHGVERLFAALLLAWAFLKSLLANLFGQKPGLRTFEENYAADRLSSVTAQERRELPTLSGCVACGLCDVGPGAARLFDLAVAGSRSMPEYDAAARSLGALRQEDIEAAEAQCPTRVPLGRLVAFVRTKARDKRR
jgi:ferredoxin